MATVTDPRDIILAPVISEKSYGLIEDNVYTFVVHPDSNKTQIKIAIEKIFKVKVDSVNTLNRQGKRKRTRAGYGKRKDTKRAIVTLAAGSKPIDLFELRPSRGEAERPRESWEFASTSRRPPVAAVPASPISPRSLATIRRSRWFARCTARAVVTRMAASPPGTRAVATSVRTA